jgi:predicted ATPase/class 3 adenylate cyclase/tetratricopeptide (TPR) repeat protein
MPAPTCLLQPWSVYLSRMATQAVESAGAVHRFILLSDIAGSSRLAETFPQHYHTALQQHNALTENAVAAQGGSVYKHTGDGYIALFETARACLACARELAIGFSQLEPLAGDAPLRVRIALHGGELRCVGTEYFGPALNRASRICQVCYPGQVLLSGAVAQGAGSTRISAGDPLNTRAEVGATDATLLDLGLHHLRDLDEPEHLYQLDDERFARHEFPPLATLNNRPNNLLQQPNQFVGRAREINELEELLVGRAAATAIGGSQAGTPAPPARKADARLVTITAPGGYGKSRLAAQLCADLLPRFERGAFFIELAPLSEHTRIIYQLASAIGFQFYGSRDPREQIIGYLREKEMLLCFDNFEHVLSGASLVSEILKTAPRIKIVATSREPLRLSGEQVYALQPLRVGSTPVLGGDPLNTRTEAGATADAALLFTDRAALVSPGFELDAANSQLIEQICAKLEGVPLAIELAAAWTDSFTLPELLTELSQQLELTARLSDVPERHRSVRASLDWSWNLLTEKQRTMLMLLSIFRGGCFADGAAAVLDMQGMPLRQALAALTDKSWLYNRPVAGQTRFFIRDMASHEYALEKLRETGSTRVPAGDSSDTHAEVGATASSTRTEAGATGSLYEHAVMSHARCFSALMEREGPRLHGHGQLEALSAIKLELLNVYEALEALEQRLYVGSTGFQPAGVEGRQDVRASNDAGRQDARLTADPASLLLPIARWLREYLDMASEYRSLLERYAALQEAVGRASELWQLSIWALLGCGWAHCRLSAYDEACVELGRAQALAEAFSDHLGSATSLMRLGNVKQLQGNYSAARELFSAALAVQRETGDRHGIALSLHSLGFVEHRQGNHAAARELCAEALTIRREIGDRYGIAAGLNNLGIVEYTQDNYAAARELHTESLAIKREIGDRAGIALSFYNLGNVEYMQGNYSSARELFAEALAIRREIGDNQGVAASLNNMGSVESGLGNYAAARELFAGSLAIKREIGDRSGIAYSLNNMGVVEYMQGNYDAARELFAGSLAIKREIGDRSGIAYSLNNMGIVEYIQGSYSAARKLYSQSLAIQREIGDQSGLCVNLAAAGCLLAAVTQHQAAAICLYGARHHAIQLHYTFDRIEGELLAQGLAVIGSAGFQPADNECMQDACPTSLLPTELSRLQAQAEAISLDGLAQFALDELEQLRDVLGPDDKLSGA